MSENNSFVRKEMISERVPPAAERGLVKWVRENLFSSAFNTIMTFISLWVISVSYTHLTLPTKA